MICMGAWSEESTTQKMKIPAALREKTRDPTRRKGLPSVTLPPEQLAASEQPTLPPPAKGRPSGIRSRNKITTVEIVAVNLRHDPRSED
jgi:hypothetical protein